MIASGAAATDVKIPLDHALYIQEYGKMGKTGYTNLRLSMLAYGVIFPTYDQTALHKTQHIIPTKLVSIFF